MIFHFALICFFVRFDARAEDRHQRSAQEIDGARYCDFDGTQSNYNASDLIRCLDQLAGNLADRESGRQTGGKSQWNGSTGRQISFAEILANLFNDFETPHQTTSFPADTASGYYQSNYPTVSGGTFDLPAGFRLNLFDALSTISRRDDYKCVPRILCEMASGKLPGRSLGKQTSNFFDFGRNAFMEWLTKVDVTSYSPLLNFGRAMILGYSNRGNSVACYSAFPKCPRDAGQLVHYLNNYNGGFFRLFNKIHIGKRRRINRVRDQRRDHSKSETEGRIITGSLIEPESPEAFGSIIQFPFYKDFRSNNEIVFPNENHLNSETTANDIVNYIPVSEENIQQEDYVPFFPQVSYGSPESPFSAMLLAQMPFVETAWGAVRAPTSCPMNLLTGMSHRFMSQLPATDYRPQLLLDCGFYASRYPRTYKVTE
ncbi:uncharacterized protein LOC116427974 [Nomia melanderi]|uniref:uncharacterized protein LOC116427974 n=1 Tax=Nomia melanderi TaxID=2448451 RepID=UPI0013043FD3|nr:uncharacterized protein LOC116427974 [Nomia melanderi]